MTWKSITESPVFEALQEKARHPFDLSEDDALVAEDRLGKYVCQSGGFTMLYGTQRVDDKVIELLAELAADCGLVEQFKAMRRGAVLNSIQGFDSEDRQVLHTASRDIFTETPVEVPASKKAQAEIEKLQKFLEEVGAGEVTGSTGKKFDTMIQVGIGGSDLGPRAVFEALRPFGQNNRIGKFIANVDPDDAAAVLEQVDLETTLVNIVSKSGSTLETLTNENLVKNALVKKGLDPAKHCIAVTGQGSPLDNPANYLRSFYMYDYIGGRYSATSMVGAVMLGFYLGIEQLREFLAGAEEMDRMAERESLKENIPLMLALLGIWNHTFLGYPTVAVLPYSQGLHRFPAHLQQCDMESNGKSIDRSGSRLTIQSGPVVWGEPGTNGQHAFYQLLHQGTEIVPSEFIGFKKSQYQQDIEVDGTSSQMKLVANMLAQSVAMATGKVDSNLNKNFDGNRPNLVLLAEKLTPGTMGALLALYEAKIVFQGFAWNINSFDQEGVQLGKVLATRFLDLMKGKVVENDGVERRMLDLIQGVRN